MALTAPPSRRAARRHTCLLRQRGHGIAVTTSSPPSTTAAVKPITTHNPAPSPGVPAAPVFKAALASGALGGGVHRRDRHLIGSGHSRRSSATRRRSGAGRRREGCLAQNSLRAARAHLLFRWIKKTLLISRPGTLHGGMGILRWRGERRLGACTVPTLQPWWARRANWSLARCCRCACSNFLRPR